MTVHTLKQCRPNQEETEYFWKLFHAAQRNDARWHGSEISIIADELSRTDLDRDQKLFLLRSWQVLVDDKGGFGRFMGAFDTYVYNMQDPDDDCVAWKPELAQILNDGNCFDILLDVYHEAQQRIAELEAREVNLSKLSVGEVMHMSGFSRDYAEGWISCSERMPEDEQEVIIHNKLGYRYVSYFDEHSGLFFDMRGGNQMNCIEHILVTHWMPLPAAPEPEQS
ncbi:DUF551 domain-containing protein [Salmonella enterica]|nr:DUF551 domain-containing protein [Salmonella enterica]EBH8408612.1 DUF551 domain-containing protein [Salmonella enterica subsp. enterica serovar Orientalis]EAR9611947.1 DUF551 domain-containing protein [Salmonella enterica]EAS0895301.1 DUF551 domain-containing protein [Salmonella enterica]EAS2577413.1 DUF551 domain-containing protein [Salmonella enterica]